MNRIQELYKLGQAVWCDNLGRRMIESGELRRLIDLGVTGVTSNPTIFMKAITSGDDYDDRMAAWGGEGGDVVDDYEGLVIPDIADAADVLRPVYDKTQGVDGYVSLEVSPRLANDTGATIAEGRRLFGELKRPNVLIKVPATDASIPAIEALIGEGVNVNVTLIFSGTIHSRVMQAYLNGLARLDADGGDVRKVASVASFFVSRVDSAVDKLLDERKKAAFRVEDLYGKAAVANAKLAYAAFREAFDPRGGFGRLASRGARVQRPLWASTSTKNPAYPDTKYIDGLIGPDTVNTMPPETISATLDHAQCESTLQTDVEASRAVLARLAELGIDMKVVTDRLTVEGVASFSRSFDELLDNVSRKRTLLTAAALR